jgi:hypothetical protein
LRIVGLRKLLPDFIISRWTNFLSACLLGSRNAHRKTAQENVTCSECGEIGKHRGTFDGVELFVCQIRNPYGEKPRIEQTQEAIPEVFYGYFFEEVLKRTDAPDKL